ncbi:MAG: hypothetical protein H0Z40_08965 [Desulfotomaculum sp.]|nr:hypothetical protein [Desulfotomaculum sp.]
MKHFTAEELRNILSRLRKKEQVNEEELEILKFYIPLHLSKDNAEKMAQLVAEIRDGKRPPLSRKEQAEMHKQNIKESLDNLVNTLPTMDDKQFEEICSMCETLRRQIAGSC